MKKIYRIFAYSAVLMIITFNILSAQGWRQAVSNTMEPLWGVYFVSETVGFCVGGSATPSVSIVYKTTDGGTTWKSVYVDETSTTLYRVHFPSSSVGYACGMGAKLIKTTDGGSTWKNISVAGASGDFLSVWFQTETTGWLLSNGGVLRTTDGGTSWTSVLALTGSTMYDMFFWGSTHGVITGKTTGDTYFTKDGITWTKASPPSLKAPYTRSDIRGVYAVSDSAIYAGGWGSLAVSQPTILIKSTDGGATWTQQLPDEPQRIFDYVYALYFKDKNNGMAFGGGSRASVAIRTTDGGSTWNPVNVPVGGSLRHAAGIGNNVWAVGENGSLIRSKDFGNTWTLIDGMPKATLYGIQFSSANTVYAAGSDGLIAKSTDAGKTWKSKFITNGSVASRIQDLFFVNEKVGYTAHSYRRAMKTTDGGESWTEIIPDTTSSTAYCMAVYFLNENLGFVAGRNASKTDFIYKTTDGGKSWDVKSNVFQANLRAIAFANANNGAVVGEALSAGYTTDGGATWKPSTFVNPPAGSSGKIIKKIVFTSPTNAVAVGDAIILNSSDAGATWNFVTPSGLIENLEGLVFQDALKGWAVGTKITSPKRNRVYQTTDGGKTWSDIADTNVIKYDYTLYGTAKDANNNLWICANNGTIFTNSPATGVESQHNASPAGFALSQNYPNPFNPSTVIDYNIESAGNVTLSVYDPLGRCVAVLVQGEQNAGRHSVKIDASDLSSGLYIYSLNVNGRILSRKMSLIK